jgi:catechol 2,3-dioxygenase
MASQITEKLPATTHMGTVTLAVANLERSIQFYTEIIGLKVLEHDAGVQAVLGAGTTPLLILQELAGAQRQPSRATGLYHVAILVPTRPDLGRLLLNFARRQFRITGVADHLVSEAIYLDDPDGNGLEIYRDRPRSEWGWDGDRVRMASDPLDIDGIIDSVPDQTEPFAGMPDGTVIGHMHLRIGSIPQAAAFYLDTLGFDLIAEMPSALFVSAGKYHHHIGMNIWHSAGGQPAPADSVGLREFVIVVPDADAVHALTERLSSSGAAVEQLADGGIAFNDPWRNRIRVEVEAT